jgi:hypothetical protein
MYIKIVATALFHLVFHLGLLESLSIADCTTLTRRKALVTAGIGVASSSTLFGPTSTKPSSNYANAATDDVGVSLVRSTTSSLFPYENRDRQGNKDALIKEDYWFMTGRTPPRVFQPNDTTSSNSDPKLNTPGTYVSLDQRRPAYSKYAVSIGLGINSYRELGGVLEVLSKQTSMESKQVSVALWDKASNSLQPASSGSLPSPIVDSLLKMLLFATSMLTSPNNSGPSIEYLVARFYVNELGFATKELSRAVANQDIERATAAWQFGKDSMNSYLTIINRAIVPKVGDKFNLIF